MTIPLPLFWIMAFCSVCFAVGIIILIFAIFFGQNPDNFPPMPTRNRIRHCSNPSCQHHWKDAPGDPIITCPLCGRWALPDEYE